MPYQLVEINPSSIQNIYINQPNKYRNLTKLHSNNHKYLELSSGDPMNTLEEGILSPRPPVYGPWYNVATNCSDNSSLVSAE